MASVLLQATLAAPRGTPGVAARGPARALGKPLKRRSQQQFAAPPPPFSLGAGGKPAAGLVFALDADAAGQPPGRALARQAARRGKRVAGLPAAAYGGCKDVKEAWVAGARRLGAWPAAAGKLAGSGEVPEELQELWAERAAIMVYDGQLQPAEAPRATLAGAGQASQDGLG